MNIIPRPIDPFTTRSLISVLTLLLFFSPVAAGGTPSSDYEAGKIFYVDANNGADSNDGSINNPFRSLSKALNVVRNRVKLKSLSDKIYLREGTYRNNSEDTVIYPLDLKGTSDNYSIISAMPAKPHSPGAIQRKSGKWYEHAIIDDSFVINTPWVRMKNNENIWVTNPGYRLSEWNNALVKRAKTIKVTDKDKTPQTTLVHSCAIYDASG